MKARGERIVCVTAYDFFGAKHADHAGVDVLLVGDSLGNVIQGGNTTLGVSLDDMIYHTRWVARAASRGLVVADLPFGSYQASIEDAVRSSIALVKAGAAAVKLEGAYVDHARAIVAAGIPCMGHVGMTPQSYHAFGGHRVQGKGDAGSRVLNEAQRLEQAGVFALVLELVPRELAATITQSLTIPTIGIGAGAACDGQIQVFHDLLGISDKNFRHVKRYAEIGTTMIQGLSEYVREVRVGEFPTEENSF